MTTDNQGKGSIELKLNTLDKREARFRTEEFTSEKVIVGYNKVEKEVITHLAKVSMPRAVWDELGSPQVVYISTSK